MSDELTASTLFLGISCCTRVDREPIHSLRHQPRLQLVPDNAEQRHYFVLLHGPLDYSDGQLWSGGQLDELSFELRNQLRA